METNYYVAQLLIGRKRHAGEENIISIEQINANYEKWINTITGLQGYKDKIDQYEACIALKLAYINLMAAIKKANRGRMVPEYEEFDRREIKEIAEKNSEKAKERFLQEKEEIRATDGRRKSEYSTLIVPQRSDIKEVTRRYTKTLINWNDNLDMQIAQGDYDLEKNQECEKVILSKFDAYEQLIDPEYKMKLDELLLFNFNPNQEKKYVPNNMAEVTYMPEKGYKHIDPITQEKIRSYREINFGSISQGDDVEIIVLHTGNLGYGRWRKNNGDVTFRDERALKEYQVIKRYKDKALAEKRKEATKRFGAVSEWNDELDGEIFTVYGNLHENLLARENVGPELVQYTQAVLLSNTNMEEAIQHNGGYIGEVGLATDREEYIVHHNQDALCTAKEFQRVSRIAPVKGKLVIYKIDEGKIELYEKDPRTKKLLREIIPVRNGVQKRKKTNHGTMDALGDR